jgi:hypothetical protein
MSHLGERPFLNDVFNSGFADDGTSEAGLLNRATEVKTCESMKL